MGNFRTSLRYMTLGLLFSALFTELAFGQFLDAKPVPTTEAGSSVAEPKLELKFAPSARVILKSKLGVIVRGEMLSMNSETALVIPDRSRFRNPDGIDYKFDKLTSLNIPDANLKWSEGEDAAEFLVKLSKSEDIAIANLDEFRLAQAALAPKPENNTTTPANGASGENVIVMQPAAKPSEDGEPITTIICGSCMKKVDLTSKSGQSCPHCGILWDNSPVNTGAFASNPGENPASMSNPNAIAAESGIGGVNENGAIQNLQQPNIQRPPTAQGGQPVAVPPPIQTQAQPTELTLENLPVWMKVSIFFACFGIMYYAFFYVR